MICIQTVSLFEKPKPNRRLTRWEEEQEKEDAAIWRRPRKYFIFDKPFHPECGPEPLVNFDLGFKYK